MLRGNARKQIGLIAGSGVYPRVFIEAARTAGIPKIVAVGFHGETAQELEGMVDTMEWVRVGQLGRMIRFFRRHGVGEAVMAGQIAPGNLFNLRPDLRTLLMLGRLRERNAEAIFGAIADELAKEDIILLPAVTYMEDCLPEVGHVAGPELTRRQLGDAAFGMRIAKEVSRLDIGQTVVVRNGTVLAVEGFEGTNACIERGGQLGKGKGLVVKVSKPNQDMRFDVPVVGPRTIEVAGNAGVAAIIVEAKATLLLEKAEVVRLCGEYGVGLRAMAEE